MKECWINVYEHGIVRWFGNPWPKKFNLISQKCLKPLYCIHVKMKEPQNVVSKTTPSLYNPYRDY